MIRRLALAPLPPIHTTIQPIRHPVNTQQVGVEEIARFVGAVGFRVGFVPDRGGGTDGHAFPGVVQAGHVTHAHVGVWVGVGGVDGAGEGDGADEAGDGRRRGEFGVAWGNTWLVAGFGV